ncbi:MAG: integration host factor subunit alpha [Deltaproteobacteria bacterium]|nr:integration host factor subunit alpha [Deltaproteobacteria bacterium]
MTVNKAEVINSIYIQCGFSKNKSTVLIETILEIIKSSLQCGEDVLISGFGKFCVNKKSRRRGRNPATGDDLTLEARRVVTFKCSGVLRDKMNGKG